MAPAREKTIAVRRDRNAITLFSRKDGTKMRFAVGSYTKASLPELVDIKITDWCDVGCTFCLDPDTLVTLDTMRRVPLRDVEPGDRLFAFGDPAEGERYSGRVATVQAKWATRKPSVRVTFDDGRTCVCSTDHKFLLARLGWREAARLAAGDRVRCHTVTSEQAETDEFKVGYLGGYSRGDGAFRDEGHGGNGRYVRLSCGDRPTIERIHAYMSDLDLDPKDIKRLWVPQRTAECWAVEKRSQDAVEWFADARIAAGRSKEYARGFVSGFFDAEGSSNGMSAIRFHQKNDQDALEFVLSTLEAEGFTIGAKRNRDGMVTVNVASSLTEVERFANVFIPANARRNHIRGNKNLSGEMFVRVTSVEPVGDRDLIDIQTSTGTFFAEGVAVHNCYQASTLGGRHSTMDNMRVVIDRLATARVFEVALGGGETTGHPQFVTILEEFRASGVVPNFTTKKPAVVRSMWPQIEHLVGGFAYSAETAGQVRMAARVLKGHVPDEKVSLHYVMGLGDRDHFVEYLRAANEVGYRVTLLGYKTVGRGKDVVPFPYDWWVDAVSALVAEGECPSLSIDTPLAEQFDGRMPVAAHMYHTREGAFSMYVDAVSMMMGASSFEQADVLVPFDEGWRARYALI